MSGVDVADSGDEGMTWMQVVCVGGGPAGLYFAVLTKLRDPHADVVVLERCPEGESFGFGVTLSDDALDVLDAADPVSAAGVRCTPATWSDMVLQVCDRRAHIGGRGLAIGRPRLLRLLADRARDLGVKLQYDYRVDGVAGLGEYSGADLVVAADGVHSSVRDANPGFGTEITLGNNYYLWLGARYLTEFTYGFERVDAGWLRFSAYPSDEGISTFIPECAPATWKALGFDQMDTAEALRELERVFARHLDGQPLQARTRPEEARSAAPWARARWVVNSSWSVGNTVLIGDAAHAVHYSIGNGTKLAVEDAVELDSRLGAHPDDVPAALRAYEANRMPKVVARQRTARTRTAWFERMDETATGAWESGDTVGFAWDLRNSGTDPLPGRSGVGYALHLATQTGAGRWARRRVVGSTARRRRAHSGGA